MSEGKVKGSLGVSANKTLLVKSEQEKDLEDRALRVVLPGIHS
jgi:hypothetical protein